MIVVDIIVFVIMLGIVEVLVHFRIQGVFENDEHHIPHDGIGICTVFDMDIVLLYVMAHHFRRAAFEVNLIIFEP